MNKHSFKPFAGLLTVVYLLSYWVLAPGCANIIPPVGGPKDSLPPVLLKAMPDNSTVDFKGNRIQLEFNEYITLEDLQNQLIINPPAEKLPEITSRLQKIYIKIKDTLQPNTTYSFDFGNAIKDVNEGNPFKRFTYLFSTGYYLDSMSLAGTIVNAETGMADSTLMIVLHNNPDDSAVAKEKPRFITRANGKGEFSFHHLPVGTFYLFAFKDEGMRRYQSPQTMFAFWGQPINTSRTDTLYELRAFVAEKEEEKLKPAAAPATADAARKKEEKSISINTSATNSQPQDLLEAFTFRFSRKLKTMDSTKLVFTDTLGKPIPYTLRLDSTAQMAVMQVKWKDNEFYRLIMQRGFVADSTGLSNIKTDTLVFKTKSESEYGTIKLNFSNLNVALHPVVQWIEGDKVAASYPLTGPKLTIPLFKPAEYRIRILYDANQNGVWDTGDYWKKRQPELVTAIDQRINIRANWENEFDINL